MTFWEDVFAWVDQLADVVATSAVHWEAQAIDEALDARDAPSFDTEWVDTDRGMQRHLGQLASPDRMALEAAADDLRKRVFAAVLKATGSPDAAGYVSDDFELIGLGLGLGSGLSSDFLS